MTNEEILDRLQDLADTWIEGGDSALARKYITELRSRLSSGTTEITITSRIKGSPDLVGAALVQFIQTNATPETVDQLVDHINRKADELEAIT